MFGTWQQWSSVVIDDELLKSFSVIVVNIKKYYLGNLQKNVLSWNTNVTQTELNRTLYRNKLI